MLPGKEEALTPTVFIGAVTWSLHRGPEKAMYALDNPRAHTSEPFKGSKGPYSGTMKIPLGKQETLNPTPYTLHPTPYTLNPKPWRVGA